MKPWTPVVKRYPHFDAVVTPEFAEKFVNSPDDVAKHTFFPFLRYVEGWTQYAKKGRAGKRKNRPIRFAARLDSCIFSFYRHLLAEPYEKLLEEAGLSGAVIAYRRIPKSGGSGGKSNIDFALSAVDTIRQYQTCCCVSLDISDFFETLDHEVLRLRWAQLLQRPRLPADHYKVYRAITQYAFVDVLKAYERLGFYGTKVDRRGVARPGYLCARGEIPPRLCDIKTFREKIADEKPDIIEINRSGRGIPQGAPLSDLLANLYLYEFDKEVARICVECGGVYLRYSDDILIIAPVPDSQALEIEERVRGAITVHGVGLEIKEAKSAVHSFVQGVDRQSVAVVMRAGLPREGLCLLC